MLYRIPLEKVRRIFDEKGLTTVCSDRKLTDQKEEYEVTIFCGEKFVIVDPATTCNKDVLALCEDRFALKEKISLNTGRSKSPVI